MSGQFFVAPIVEGHGEVEAVPVLLRRIAAKVAPTAELRLNHALRVKVNSFRNDADYFRRYVELAARKARAWPKSCVLILIDSEDDCPHDLGPQILNRAKCLRPDVEFAVILAYREYETWFLAAARSLRGICGLPENLVPPAQPELLRDAKSWLSAKMGVPYNEPEHRPRMTAEFSFDEASSVHSFRRGLSKIEQFFS